jgi:hypothetical protein
MTRYQVTELTPFGYGRRFYAERLSMVKTIVIALGGRWRVVRQYHWDGKWHRDGDRAEWVLE